VGLIIYVDGGARGNPGPSGAGVVIADEDGTLIHEAGYYLGRQTNNAAEYHAVIRALARAAADGAQALCVHSDSQLLVRQVTGQYEVKSPKLLPLFRQVQTLLLRVPRWSFRHINREENLRADELANMAMDRRADVLVFDVDSRANAAAATASANLGPAADPEQSTSKPEREPAAPDAATARAVHVTRTHAPLAGACPTGQSAGGDFTVATTLPAGLCVYAAHSILPTILAILNTPGDEFAAIPTLTLRCTRPGCGAVFNLSSARSPNGARRKSKN
jgi:ribonuclease HI